MEIKYSVKDKNNLLSHNQWSGGDYNPNLIEISNGNGVETIISDEYSYNGDHSFKITTISNTQTWAEIRVNQLLNDSQGKLTIYTPENNMSVYLLITYDDYTQDSSSVSVYSNSNPQDITIPLPQYDSSKTFLRISLRISFPAQMDNYCFIDNINLSQ